ncbi:MAG: glycosyltransferase family 2 protein [Lachnospiraceae bacterium]|nr:glycosyltransferase family 2 protein [Candidatus Colinaster scatohippi]
MIDVIIPTYKPGVMLWRLIDMLSRQTVRVNRIILMNTEESGYKKLIECDKGFSEYEGLEVHHIDKKDFDHGKTRNVGISYSKADIVILMTQDAMPCDESFVEKLTEKLSDKTIAACYARQLANLDSTIVEQVTREFNYPAEDMIKSQADVERLGIKAYFCSNVSCAYNREIFDELGGFIDHTIFNEDMIYAAKAIKNGYKIAYASEAKVYHSHNYSAAEQFHRNVDIGISQAEHPEVFEGISSESEGIKMVKTTIGRLWDGGQKRKIIPYIYMTGCKYIGYKIGKKYRKLPMGFVKRCSMNPEYFDS